MKKISNNLLNGMSLTIPDTEFSDLSELKNESSNFHISITLPFNLFTFG